MKKNHYFWLKQKRQPLFLQQPFLIFELIGKPLYWFLLLLFSLSSWLLKQTRITLKRVFLIDFTLSKTALAILKSLLPSSPIFPNCFKKFPKPSFVGLRKLPRLRSPSRKFWFSILLLGVVYTGYFLIFNFFYGLPNPDELIDRPPVVSTKIYDRHGTLLYKIYRHENRSLVKLDQLPIHLIQATVAIEDAEFYQHNGFSPKAIVRAFFQNLNGDKLYGASTITQQLVKNALLKPERTWRRKIRELVLAVGAEMKFTKDQILQMYLNEVGYGGATYGIEEAAQTYFGKSAATLDLAEAALLTGLPGSPTHFSPFGAHPEKAKTRQLLVLDRMYQEGFITREELERARIQELHFIPQKTDIQAPHFVMYVKSILVEKYGEQMVERGGLEVITSLDLNLQEKAQAIVAQEIDNLAHLHITNGAALVTRPKTGELLVMVGSKDYFNLEADGNVNVALRSRQPGSSIKPINYALALENGFTAASIIADTPITYQVLGQPPYSPRNYDNRFHGNVSLRVALASSFNVPAVKVLASLGVDRMINLGRQMGITTWENPSRFGLSLTLGSGEIKMTDLAVAYGVLANNGFKQKLQPILEIRNYRGKILEKLTPPELKEKVPVINPGTAFILTDILSDNQARTPAFGPNSLLNIDRHPHVAVKTGTTQNMRDNWTVGYTNDYLVASWVGNNDNSPMSYVASGVTGASPIWNEIMSELLKDLPDWQPPAPKEVNKVEICPYTGTLPCQGCGGKWEFFLTGTEPTKHCQPIKTTEKVLSD